MSKLYPPNKGQKYINTNSLCDIHVDPILYLNEYINIYD
jgi:hypothetical protein